MAINGNIRKKRWKSKMEEDAKLEVDGVSIFDMRVVDLKKELDKRNLSKSGTKKQLFDRLKTVKIHEKHSFKKLHF